MNRLFFLAAGMFAMGCEDYLFAGLLPGISVSLHTRVVAVAQGCATFGLAYVLAIPLCAFLLSRKSPRQVLITALILFMIGNAITLLSTNWVIYVASRFVAGLGGGLFLPVAVAAGTQLVETGFRGRALSVMWSANSVGAVIGVPLGLWLARRVGWRATVIMILGLATFALVGIVIRKQALRVEGPPPSLEDQLRLLKNPRVLAVVGVTLLTATGCLGLYAYISQVVAGTENSSAMAYSLWSIGGFIGSTGIGYVVDRVGKPQVVMAVILSILLLTITGIPVLRGVPLLGLAPFLVWGAMGWASVTPQQSSLIEIKANHEAILIALNSSAVSLGSVIGTVLGGVALAGGLSPAKIPYVTSVFVACALACQLLLVQKRQRKWGQEAIVTRRAPA
jgi:predicted MFS family arabinose efflux permease